MGFPAKYPDNARNLLGEWVTQLFPHTRIAE